ncbi:hypothetical protein SELMODRAFT_426109 [Selaginella moellendorffii]|uniref:H(+)-exporting diphosphatase n=2 Tax=Selaginella moellendorffii TaxID=88036 RepID=D8SVC2_SELML|nr:hypothetical protein SELMODRAFT_426109 [Selaginella moellendorffii]
MRRRGWAFGLGLGLGFALLLLAPGAAGYGRRAPSPGIFNVSDVNVPAFFRSNANQVASKATKALNIAVLKFPRLDALQKFKKYNGEFDVINKHYWASVAFIGIWGYVLAVLTFMCACMVCACKFCCYLCGYKLPTKDEGGSLLKRCSRMTSLLLLLVCTIAGTAVLFWGTSKTGKQLKQTTDVVINATDFVLDTADEIVSSLKSAAGVISDPTASANILSAANNVDGGSGGIGVKVSKIKKKIPFYLKLVFIFLNIIGAFICLFAVIGLVAVCAQSSTYGNIAFMGMAVMLFAAWLLAGLDFVLSRVTNDACEAMREYNADPTTTTLATIFPCQSQASASSTTGSAKSALKDIIAQTNSAITTINSNTGSSLPQICDPYGAGPGYADVACALGTTPMADFQTDFGPYRCVDDVQASCTASNTPILNSNYQNMATAMSAGATVYSLIPNVNDILTCTFIHNAFNVLVTGQCVKLIDGLNISWFGFALSASFMMPLQLYWIFI